MIRRRYIQGTTFDVSFKKDEGIVMRKFSPTSAEEVKIDPRKHIFDAWNVSEEWLEGELPWLYWECSVSARSASMNLRGRSFWRKAMCRKMSFRWILTMREIMESVCSGRMATERRFIRLTELKSCSPNPIRHSFVSFKHCMLCRGGVCSVRLLSYCFRWRQCLPHSVKSLGKQWQVSQTSKEIRRMYSLYLEVGQEWVVAFLNSKTKQDQKKWRVKSKRKNKKPSKSFYTMIPTEDEYSFFSLLICYSIRRILCGC